MSTGAIAGIVIAIVVIAAIAAAVVLTSRRRRLKERFGPEYDRVAGERSGLAADAELAQRERRVRGLEIRPLTAEARNRYAAQWATIQEQFVDSPQTAVTEAQTLVTTVMNERGYPADDHDQVLADLSVEHAATVDHFRSAHEISQQAESGAATTEDLRRAMIHYRELFGDLLGGPGQPDAAGTGADGGPAQAASAGAPYETGLDETRLDETRLDETGLDETAPDEDVSAVSGADANGTPASAQSDNNLITRQER